MATISFDLSATLTSRPSHSGADARQRPTPYGARLGALLPAGAASASCRRWRSLSLRAGQRRHLIDRSSAGIRSASEHRKNVNRGDSIAASHGKTAEPALNSAIFFSPTAHVDECLSPPPAPPAGTTAALRAAIDHLALARVRKSLIIQNNLSQPSSNPPLHPHPPSIKPTMHLSVCHTPSPVPG